MIFWFFWSKLFKQVKLHCITMQSISVKFTEEVIKKVDSSIKEFNYNSRTEFIRDAIRFKLEDLEKKKLVEEFLKLKGSMVKKAKDDDLLVKTTASELLLKELNERF
jgi:metal-responsive CopG/Arc/MetJ family transcriptional regulator